MIDIASHKYEAVQQVPIATSPHTSYYDIYKTTHNAPTRWNNHKSPSIVPQITGRRYSEGVVEIDQALVDGQALPGLLILAPKVHGHEAAADDGADVEADGRPEPDPVSS